VSEFPVLNQLDYTFTIINLNLKSAAVNVCKDRHLRNNDREKVLTVFSVKPKKKSKYQFPRNKSNTKTPIFSTQISYLKSRYSKAWF